MALQEGGQRLDQLALTEGMRHPQPQRAGELLATIELLGQRLPAVDQFLRLRGAALALLGQAQAARRALHQPRAEQRFQHLHPAADGRLGGRELQRRRGETARLRDTEEGLQQREAVLAAIPDKVFHEALYTPGVWPLCVRGRFRGRAPIRRMRGIPVPARPPTDSRFLVTLPELPCPPCR